MSDPYKVLGITPSATDDEVKKAYRDLSRKYHPDANINNPNKDKAEEMFKLVQQAYDQIMNERKNGTSYSSGGYGSSSAGGYGGFDAGDFDDFFGGFGSFGGYGRSGSYGGGRGRRSSYNQSNNYYTAAANYINSGHYQEALNVLNNIEERNAEWYYLSAIANNGVGNNIMALDLAKKAAQMDPSNSNYQRLVQTLESGGQWYSDRQYSFGGDRNSMCCSADPCATLCLLSLCCRC